MSVTKGQSAYAMQQAIVAALQHPSRFPRAAQNLRLIETHISWVLLAGRHAWKIKKALDLGFLDFTTLQARRFYCEEEIRLNRRLAPDIYLDVVPIGGTTEAPEFDVQPAIEYAVRMRRFDTTQELDHLLEHGKLLPQHIDRLAAVVAEFHQNQPAAYSDSPFGTRQAIHAAARQNFEQLHSLLTEKTDLDAVDRLAAATEHSMQELGGHFDSRHAQGFVRECHGDLHLGNIVLVDNEPVPFDGIEFNPGFRWIDAMDEVAFLVMDLLYRQRGDLAFRFLNAWLEQTGDYAGLKGLRFYLAYRATVRAKVCAIRASQAIHGGIADGPIDKTTSHLTKLQKTQQVIGYSHSTRLSNDDSQVAGYQPNQPQAMRKSELADCRAYLRLAHACLAAMHPALVITHGLPGSGKSRFARAAVERLGAIRIRSDVERKRLFGLKPLESSRSGAGTGIYGAEATQQTYAHLQELARGIINSGFTVVVDAAFLKQEERDQFGKLARELGVPFVIASMQAAPAALEARVKHRQAEGKDASEAGLAVLRLLQEKQQPLTRKEIAITVTFRTDDEGGGVDAANGGWERLAGLLAP